MPSDFPSSDTLVSVAEAAKRLNIGRRAVIHRIHAGTLAATKIGEGRTASYVLTDGEIERARQAALAPVKAAS